jgi:ankyrin repeat protein
MTLHRLPPGAAVPRCWSRETVGTVTDPPDDATLMALFGAIAARNADLVSRMLDSSPELALAAIRTGASRQDAQRFFLDDIRHYVYAADTGLHFAAASYQRAVAELLVARGAHPRARNRRGAEPLHYAADGNPDGSTWDPAAQREVIEYLVAVGADPNACDSSGVSALHRAVRTRCSTAVHALLDSGADPRLKNKRGSTPLHLAVQNTGRSNSGTDAAKDEQRRVIVLLLQHGARPTDTDAKGKTAESAATGDWIRDVLRDA